MSYTNGTTHYNLPQTTGSDKRDWADSNQAFADIDAAIYGAVQDTAQAALDIDALEGRMDTAEQNISTNAGNISGLDTRLTTAEGAITSQAGQITDTRQDLEDMICAYNEASATSTHRYEIGDYFIYNDVLYKATQVIAIGDTIVPDTNCATTNVTTELLSKKSNILFTFQGDGATSYSSVLDSLATYISLDTARDHRYFIEISEGAQNKYGEITAIGYTAEHGIFFACSIFMGYGGNMEWWKLSRSANGASTFRHVTINITDAPSVTCAVENYSENAISVNQTIRLFMIDR